MFLKKSLLTGLTLSMSMGAQTAFAGNDFLPGLIIGGIIGAGIAQNQGRTTRGTTRRSGIASTQEGKDIQSALNYFGFPAGPVDGQLGRKSYAAISNYQAYMGFPSNTGITDFEKDFLLTSHQRAMLGGPVISQIRNSSFDGNRALLLHFRDELNGVAAPSTATLVQPVVPSVIVPSVVPATTPVPLVQPAAPAAPGLPSFFSNTPALSLASHCNSISLETNANGGFITQATMVDPTFTLGEQFCMARTYAIAHGEDLLATVPGVTADQVSAQCDGFVPVMQQYVAALALEPSENVLKSVSGFIGSSGMSPADLSGSARICLSVGYRSDNLPVAIGSALLLTALGEKPYGELLGHHLSLGFGVDKRPDLALAWYDDALTALANGSPAVFGSNMPNRAGLIHSAAYAMTSGAAIMPNDGTSPNANPNGLPVFQVSQ